METEKKNKIRAWITISVFCTLLGVFSLATFIVPKKEYSETENRELAGFPDITAESIFNGKFEAGFEDYLTDHFVGRDGWVDMKTMVERLLLKTESKDIYFAKDGYFIEKHSDTFTTDTAQRNLSYLSQFESKYKERFGDRLSVMIVPNAVDILRDKLPPLAAPYDEELYLEQISNVLEGSFFDTAVVLREHKDEDLFYKTDHHWKTLAAFYVYQAWAELQGFYVPEITDFDVTTVSDGFQGTIQSKLGIQTKGDTIELFLPKNDISYTVKKGNREAENSLYDYAALETKDKYSVYFGGNYGIVNIKTQNKNGRKALMIKDSYANCFIPFMIGEFEEIDIVDLRYTNQRLSQTIELGGYTDMLVLYNAAGFAEDISIAKLLN